MAILRAGPFADSTDSYLDEPSTANATIIPVNCAMNNWVSDNWKYYLLKLTTDAFGVPNVVIDEEYRTGAAVSESYNGPSGPRKLAEVMVKFAYQAVEDTTININAKAVGVPAGLYPVSVEIGDDFTGEESSGTSYQTVEMDQDFTLPATVVPKIVTILAAAEGNITSSATSSITITIPTSP
jgi:hypothetical protein